MDATRYGEGSDRLTSVTERVAAPCGGVRRAPSLRRSAWFPR
jgi:hypothetical protein